MEAVGSFIRPSAYNLVEKGSRRLGEFNEGEMMISMTSVILKFQSHVDSSIIRSSREAFSQISEHFSCWTVNVQRKYFNWNTYWSGNFSERSRTAVQHSNGRRRADSVLRDIPRIDLLANWQRDPSNAKWTWRVLRTEAALHTVPSRSAQQ